jgi:hypothetical protein
MRFKTTALFFAWIVPTRAGFYDCTDGVECASTYGAPTVGTEAQMEAACDADVNCMAYQWNELQQYGVSYTPVHSHMPPLHTQHTYRTQPNQASASNLLIRSNV